MINKALASILAIWCTASAADEMRLAVTTSFDSSGLAEVLLPAIKADLDLDVQLLVVGTGQALRLGEAGDVDAVLVHSKAAEEAFVAAGHGTHRRGGIQRGPHACANGTVPLAKRTDIKPSLRPNAQFGLVRAAVNPTNDERRLDTGNTMQRVHSAE